MISLKKYLDMNWQEALAEEPESGELFTATLNSYRTLLNTVGKTAAQISPLHGSDLESNLQSLERRISFDPTPESIKHIEKQVEVHLHEWGGRLSEHMKERADEVREILVALARTAESVGSRDQGYASQFKEVTERLSGIANLEDLTEIRTSLVKQASALKTSVDQMTRDNHELVAQLRAEVSIYEIKLRTVEQLSLRDELTRVANRRSIEERIRWAIESKQTFCVVMFDLNGFKQVNDKYGHLAGDDLLKQFAVELQTNTRSGDVVGRWGGDKFVVVLASDLAGTAAHIDRVRKWVFGKYTLQLGKGDENPSIQVDASIGISEWKSGKTMQDLIAESDTAMYQDKKRSRKGR